MTTKKLTDEIPVSGLRKSFEPTRYLVRRGLLSTTEVAEIRGTFTVQAAAGSSETFQGYNPQTRLPGTPV